MAELFGEKIPKNETLVLSVLSFTVETQQYRDVADRAGLQAGGERGPVPGISGDGCVANT